MKLTIERAHLDLLVDRFADLEHLRSQLRLGERAVVEITDLSQEQCDFLVDLYRGAGSDHQIQAAQIITLRGVMEEPRKIYGGEELEDFMVDLARYLTSDAIRGWLFSNDIS
ncbi:MAG: hypothetical protein OIF40_08210, partial [Mangrovicoccus sp.]|nr:hypothetical protein [Mangrovicoccus sp.]